MKWAVHIEGNPIDLENWASEFSATSDPNVQALPGSAEGEQTYVLGWSGFDSAMTTIEAVHLARVLVRQMNGLVACLYPDSEVVNVSGKVAQIQDGAVLLHQTLQASSGSYRVRGATATLKVSGTSSHPTPKLCLSWMTKCGSNDALGDAVSLLGGARDWYDLYKVWEALTKKDGEKAVIDKGWTSKKDLRRLKRTINHYRHYSEELPSNALSYEDARSRITELVRKALEMG
jgi:hypothetical protein